MPGGLWPWLFGVAGFVALAAAVVAYLREFLSVAAAFKAKVACSGIFLAGRVPASVLAEDVAADSYRFLRFFRASVDERARTVTASWLGLREAVAVCRPGSGAVLVWASRPGGRAPEGSSHAGPAPAAEPAGGTVPGAVPGSGAARPAASVPWRVRIRPELQRVVDAAFDEPRPAMPRRTRAVVVVLDGAVAAERYAPGFDERTPLAGWSMTKSVFSALAGVLVGQGRLSPGQDCLLPEWSLPGDPRRAVTVEDLLRMRSGLNFREVYSSPVSDVTHMLFASRDSSGYAASRPLAARPGSRWAYSSGNTNILSRVMRRILGEDEYPLFPRRALFNRVGMDSAVVESDAAGCFVASSFMYATARDWARFGWLHAQDGAWDGGRVLPEGWVAFCSSPTPQAPAACYGAGWWLRLHDSLGGATPAAREIPADAFHALGHEGQAVTVIPSRRLAVARLGLSVAADSWDHAAFLASLLNSL